MASIKVKLRPSVVAEHEGSIYYQIIHERKVRQLLSDYKVFPAEWDDTRSTVVANPHSVRRYIVSSIRECIRRDLARLMKIDRRLDSSGVQYSAEDVIDEFKRYSHEYSLFNYMSGIIKRLRLNGKIRTSETYKSTLNSFRHFLSGRRCQDFSCYGDDIMLEHLTSEIMEEYEGWLRQRGAAPNTISFYARILRAVYNRAVEQGVIDDRSPFRHIYTGVDKTVKRALPIPLIKRIRTMDLSLSPAIDYARDMFLMSFYLRGMSLIDMAFLKKSDLRDGKVVYRRHKTGQQLIIAWTSDMQRLLDKYRENASDYLLPIIKRPGTVERFTYLNAGYKINQNLKKLAKKVGVQIPLTLYVARHSWASAARANGIPVSVISEGLGHDSETTTQIYLASLDTSAVDKANSLIIDSLK